MNAVNECKQAPLTYKVLTTTKLSYVYNPPPLTSTWPHLRCDVALQEGKYRENCLCFAVLCTIIMVHTKIRAVLTGRSTVSGFDLA